MRVAPTPPPPSDGLTPFVATLLAEAAGRLESALTPFLGDAPFTVTPSRRSSPETAAATQLDLQSAKGAFVRIFLHTSPSRRGARPEALTGAWAAGPVRFSVHREADGGGFRDNGEVRALLARLVAVFRDTAADDLASWGAALHEAHHHWATVAYLEERFYRHVEHAHSGTTGLLRATFVCSQDCHFCWEGRDWPAAPEELVFQWLEELAAAGVRRLTLCGGEPTLFRRLPELIARAAQHHGMIVHMNTNAIKLRNPAYAAQLREAGLRSLMISIHSHLSEVSDRMTRAPGTWAGTVAGIHGALDAGFHVILNGLVEQDNAHLVADHAAWLVREFVDKHPDNPILMVNYNQPGKYYDNLAFLEHIAPLDVARPFVVQAARTLHAAGVFLDIAGTCGFPACVAVEVPELLPWRDQGAMDDHNLSGRTQAPEPCQACAAFSQCAGTRREYVQRHGGRGLVPFLTPPSSDWYVRLAAHPAAASWGDVG
jgi:pyruvate-formate lyase-activating enzyme